MSIAEMHFFDQGSVTAIQIVFVPKSSPTLDLLVDLFVLLLLLLQLGLHVLDEIDHLVRQCSFLAHASSSWGWRSHKYPDLFQKMPSAVFFSRARGFEGIRKQEKKDENSHHPSERLDITVRGLLIPRNFRLRV